MCVCKVSDCACSVYAVLCGATMLNTFESHLKNQVHVVNVVKQMNPWGIRVRREDAIHSPGNAITECSTRAWGDRCWYGTEGWRGGGGT